MLEYVLGTDLRDAHSRALPEASLVIEGESGSFLELRHRQRDGVADFAIGYQMSDDLTEWVDAGGFLQIVETVDNGDGTSTVTLRSVVGLGALEVDARFVRIVVTGL